MHDGLADLSTLDATGNAVTLEGRGLVNGSTDCLGGGGVFGSAQDFLALMKAVLVEGSKLLKEKSYEELFKPQLSGPSKQASQALLESDSGLYWGLGGNIALSGQKSWNLGGKVSLDNMRGGWGRVLFSDKACRTSDGY